MTSVTAQLPQWRRALRAAQPSEELLYELSINLETGIALYLVSDGSGSISPPHEHQTWAVIAGASGTELNHIYRRVEEWSWYVVEVERIVLGSGNTLVLTEESIHAAEAIGDTPTYHLHLYGKPLSRLPRFSNRTLGWWLPMTKKLPNAPQDFTRLENVSRMYGAAQHTGKLTGAAGTVSLPAGR